MNQINEPDANMLKLRQVMNKKDFCMHELDTELNYLDKSYDQLENELPEKE